MVDPGYIFYNNNGRQVGARTEFARKVVSFSFSIGDQRIKQLTSSDEDDYACYSPIYDGTTNTSYYTNITTDGDHWYNYDSSYGKWTSFVDSIFKSLSVSLDLSKQILVSYIVTNSTDIGIATLPLIFNISLPRDLPDGCHYLRFFESKYEYVKREYHLDVVFRVASNSIVGIFLTDHSANPQSKCNHSGTVIFKQCL